MTLGLLRYPAVALLFCAGFVAGCGGGDDANASAAPPAVLIDGVVTFDLVPASTSGLDYTATRVAPARSVTVEALAGDEVLAAGKTGAEGRYALQVPADTDGLRIRVVAEIRREGGPSFAYRVLDNTAGDALYVLESDPIAVEQADRTVDLHAASGWDGAAYAAPRSAAPFAILDVVLDATERVAAIVPGLELPPLTLHWSPDNVPARGPDGEPNFATGEIGSSLFRTDWRIFLLGDADSDADEYDRHVIAHEWGHFLEHALGRSDSIGGPHTRGDQLDPRTAFSEGFANAFAAIVTDDPLYVDTLGPGQAHSFAFDVEGPFDPTSPQANPHPGWFSEESVQEVVYDLYDDRQDTIEDTIALGLAPLVEVLRSGIDDGVALTSIFAFADALRARTPEAVPAIDALLAAHAIGPFTDAYGSGETNAGTPLDPTAVQDGDILPVYKPVAIDGSVNVCSTDAYTYAGPTGGTNKLGIRAFVRFDTETAGTYAISATATEVPAGAIADPDIALHSAGLLARSEEEPGAACTASTPSGCAERFEDFLGAGSYVLEVYEWTNTQRPDEAHPPIGRTCFDVEVARR